nr:learning induced brain peptide [Carassius auratus]
KGAVQIFPKYGS